MSDNKKKQKHRIDFKTLFNDNRFLKIVSTLAAIALWLSVSLGEDNSVTVIIDKVPVDTTAISQSIESVGMEIVGGAEQTVSVRVEGRREVVGNLTAKDIRVTPQIGESITGAGTYSLRLNATKSNNLDSYEIVSVTPERINLTLDRVQSKKFTVEIDITSVSAVDKGLLLGEPTCSVTEVAVKGAQNIIDSIDSVVAKVTPGGVISRSTTYTAKLMYFDAAGNQLDVAKDIIAEIDEVSIVVPVLKEKSMELRVGFTNVPDYLNTDFIRYSLDNKSILVAAPIDVVDSIQNLTAGYLDLSKAQVGSEVSFEIELPAGFVNRDDFTSVKLTLDPAYFSARAFNISSFNVKGVPEGYTVTVKDAAVDGVSMVGLTSDVTSLKEEEISMEIDASSLIADGKITTGERKINTSVIVSSGKTVWATGSYTVTVNVEKE